MPVCRPFLPHAAIENKYHSTRPSFPICVPRPLIKAFVFVVASSVVPASVLIVPTAVRIIIRRSAVIIASAPVIIVPCRPFIIKLSPRNRRPRLTTFIIFGATGGLGAITAISFFFVAVVPVTVISPIVATFITTIIIRTRPLREPH